MLQLNLFVFKLHINTFVHIMLYSLYEVCCFGKSDIKVLLIWREVRDLMECCIVCSNVVCDGDVACCIPTVLTKSLFIHSPASLLGTPGLKKRKYPVSSSCVDENALLMREVRGEWADWLEMIERQQ